MISPNLKEIGSLTTQGADSNFLPTVLSRLSALPASQDGKSSQTAFEESLSKSFLVSADMAHAVHPNYAIKYEDKHKPKLNHGVVLKVTVPYSLRSDCRSTQTRATRRIRLEWC